MNYIIDPELRYIQTMPGGRFSIMRITQRIDLIFNMICKKIKDVIGDQIGLKFFLRRTLAGCEFGICFDVTMKVNDLNNSLLNNYYCLIDKDPPIHIEKIFENLINYLEEIIAKQIAQITEIDVNLGQVLNNLFNLQKHWT